MANLKILGVLSTFKSHLCVIKKAPQYQNWGTAQTVIFFDEAMIHNRKPNANPTCSPIIKSLPPRKRSNLLKFEGFLILELWFMLMNLKLNRLRCLKYNKLFLNTINNQITT